MLCGHLNHPVGHQAAQDMQKALFEVLDGVSRVDLHQIIRWSKQDVLPKLIRGTTQ